MKVAKEFQEIGVDDSHQPVCDFGTLAMRLTPASVADDRHQLFWAIVAHIINRIYTEYKNCN